MTPQQRERSKRINIEIPDDLDAVYANMAVITHSPSEIVIDFSRVLPNEPKSRVQARVVMTPMNAKSLLKALSTNLERYESRFGEVKMPDTSAGDDDSRTMGFVH